LDLRRQQPLRDARDVARRAIVQAVAGPGSF